MTLPSPRRPDPRSVPVLRWGVLGTGWVAERFVDALRAETDQQVVAVGSRTRERAASFADRYAIERRWAGVEELAQDPEVDVVYVATPAPDHRDAALAAIAAGKHVLIEKPLALDAGQAREVLDAAERAGVACLEAMWTMFLPRFDVVRQILAEGLLGDVRSVVADHGEQFPATHRAHDPAAGGGALLDLGTYVTSLATWVLGPAREVTARGELTGTGVDGESAALLVHDGGATSLLHTSIVSRTPTAAFLAGTRATLQLPGPFFMPGDVVLTSGDGSTTTTWRDPQPDRHASLYVSAVELAYRIGAGETSSPLHPRENVLANLEALDEITRQVRLQR